MAWCRVMHLLHFMCATVVPVSVVVVVVVFFRATNKRGIMKNLSLLISSPVVVLIDECIFENSYNVFLTFTDLYFLYSTDDKLIRKK